ncbi:DNA polymerase IV [Epidermidibacterium keratini]|uniref:DNA polymerase IV n=1 Tax=Epidermidibacterium keratini TaxID=1891644 RepID=A0A7L4YN15_9ACTN|nr:DNA polymerase IV [Epidermidibacterium keratini]QHC00681.1 DNA polymerase IV [Epidermidibacterium keratini]
MTIDRPRPGVSQAPVPGLWMLHVDLDQFVAAVEIRRDPSLRGTPVIVGGSGDPQAARQVVATASYEARAVGVRSGMPLRTAYRKCPEAVFLPTDHAAYDAASAEVMEVLRSFGMPVEVWGWDEAFVGAQVDEPQPLARRMREEVLQRTGFGCAIGIGDTKERAKMATGFAKVRSKSGEAGTADGVYQLDASNWLDVMGERPAGELWGIGAKTAAKLAAHGIHTVIDLAASDHHELAGWFGPTIGPSLKLLGRGGRDVEIRTEPYVARSRGKQVTYPHDLNDPEEIRDAVLDLARQVRDEIASEGRIATHVGVTVRTSTFYTRTKTSKLSEPTTQIEPIRETALRVLGRFEVDRPVRLLGVRLDLLMPPE